MGCCSSKDAGLQYADDDSLSSYGSDGSQAEDEMDNEDLIELKESADTERKRFRVLEQQSRSSLANLGLGDMAAEAVESTEDPGDMQREAHVVVSAVEPTSAGTTAERVVRDTDWLPAVRQTDEEKQEAERKRKAEEEDERLRVQEAQRKAQEDAEKATREKEAAELKAKEEADAAAKAAADTEKARRVAEEAREQERLANERMEAAIKAKQEAAEAEAIRLAEEARLEAERLAAEAAAEAEALRKAKEEAERLELKAKEEAREAAAAAKAQAEEEAARLVEQKAAEKAERDRTERLAKEEAERQEAEQAQAKDSLAPAPAVAEGGADAEAGTEADTEAAALKEKRKLEREEGARHAQDRLAQEKMMMKRREMSLHNRRHASRKSEAETNSKSPSGRSKAGLALAAELSDLSELAEAPANTNTPPPATPGGSDQAFTLTPANENRLAKKSVKKSRKSKRPGQSVRGGFLARFSRRKQTSGAKSTPRKSKSRRSPLKDKQAPAMPGEPGEFKRLPGMVSVAELDSGEVNNSEYEKLDPRAVDAARWTDKVVRQLIDEIKQRGTANASGQAVVTFGTLFEETANIFDALVGILKTAKKYFIVSFGPDQLWQGKDDAVEITLLKETHSGVLVKRRKLKNMKAPGSNVKSKGFGAAALTGNQKCHMCSKTVYQNERVVASDKPFHKSCFRCKVCNTVLKTTDFCTVDDKFFCPTHYREMIMAAGGPGSENKAGVADNFRKERRLSDV